MKNMIVLITAANKKEAEKIAGGLIAKRLAACVNIVDKINSLFWWQGKVDRAKEVLLVVKTKQSAFKKIIREVKKLHSYDLPEIIAIPIIAGEKKYLRWLNESIR
ncbi:MAG: divalent-cation tolerance protein CutA [Candidatus Omnitrophota bacterium]|nr:divalent-cation tolerance protein CutA [Candidatus Omnitrophota bacterium]